MTGYSYEYEFPVPLSGSREKAFEALTDRGALEAWFAEHVNVDPREGGSFRFWGRYTFGRPAMDEADQVIVAIEPPTKLAFTWRLLNSDSTVTWRLVDHDGDNGSEMRIRVNHDFDRLPEIARAEQLIDDLWRIYTGALCFYLNGETDIYRPVFANDDPEVRTSIVIDAPPASVFAALIVPEHIKQWFPAPAPVVEPRVGGDYGFGFRYEVDGKTVEPPPMKILEFVENRKLTITWPDWRLGPSVPDQKVTWLLEPMEGKDGRTRLTLVHDGFVRAVDVSDYPFGWQQFLIQIRDVAQSLAR